MTRLWTVGIDPGATGAIAAIDQHSNIGWIYDMPYEGKRVVAPLVAELLRDLIDPRSDDAHLTVWIEQVGPMPKQGLSSTWRFAQGYGTLLGVIGAIGARTKHVTPAVWKRNMSVSKVKGTSRALATELWPNRADMFRRVKDDGRAEACLIAEYGRRQELQQ